MLLAGETTHDTIVQVHSRSAMEAAPASDLRTLSFGRLPKVSHRTAKQSIANYRKAEDLPTETLSHAPSSP